MGKAKTGAVQRCATCGSDFYAAGWETSGRRQKPRRFCSTACGYKGRVRMPTKTEAERFWPKVDKRPGGCWVWTASKDGGGYGVFALTQMPGTPRKHVKTHRWSYELTKGPIPVGLEIDHLCRVRACCNPDHLEAVTPQVNVRRGISGEVNGARQRAITHCPQGHAYDEANTHVRKTGKRQCRACNAAARRRRTGCKPLDAG